MSVSAPDDIAKGFLPYNREAQSLRTRYAEVPFEKRHSLYRSYFPVEPGWVLDVGAGIGVDAKGFAGLGYMVVAVEPADEMRAIGMEARDHDRIKWLSDYLPSLDMVRGLNEKFDFILVSASFMHLSPAHQAAGFATLRSLLAPRGYLAMSLRHGPVPDGRTMFEISPARASRLAMDAGLETLVHKEGSGRKTVPGVTWSNFLFAPAGH